MGVMAAIGCGTAIPFMTIRFGSVIQIFIDNDLCNTYHKQFEIWNNTLQNSSMTAEMGGMSIKNMENEDVDMEVTIYQGVPKPEQPPHLECKIVEGKKQVCKETMKENKCNKECNEMMSEIQKFAKKMMVIGGTVWFLSYFFVMCLNYTAERQVFRIRTEFLRSVLRQDVSWYDMTKTSDFATRMTEDLNKLQEGIGEKVGMLCFFLSTFISSIAMAFMQGWELTSVILTMMPLMGVTSGFMAKAGASFADKEISAYSKAGSVAEEALSSITTVAAFSGEKKEVERYTQMLKPAKRSGILRNTLTGASGGITFIIMYAVYGLGFWYGVKLIHDGSELDDLMKFIDNQNDASCQVRYTPERLVVIFFSVLLGGFQIGQSAPYAEALGTARSAARSIYSIIGRKPPIDSLSEKGQKPITIADNISLKNIVFSYPARKQVKVLKGLSFEVKKGQTVALVGPSGCGKSTTIQILQRLYDPDEGSVDLDGINIKNLNVGYLRDRIGVVGQEPVLFDLNILENIRVGKGEITQDEVVRACKEANAFDFIMKLPKRFDTMVGEGGAQLSGGQKQRIAIARALVRNPSILLLDEATSALDGESEQAVQAALEKARTGRTTIIVAHRLSTIRNADTIIVMNNGRVEEQGTHRELMEKGCFYHSLVTRQVSGSTEVDEEEIILQSIMDQGNGEGTSHVNFHPLAMMPNTDLNEVADITADDVIKEIDQVEIEEDPQKVEFWAILRLNLSEWPCILVGVLSSICMGGVMPIFALLFGNFLGILSEEDHEHAKEKSIEYAIMSFFFGIASGTAMFLQGFMFGISGECLTMKLRVMAFEAMLKQEMGWFDDQKNNTGALCARLSSDAAKVQGATGARIGSVVQGVAGMLFGIFLGIYYSWKLGLVASFFFPFLILAAFLHMKIIMRVDTVEKKAFERSAKLAIDAITNIRTVASTRSEESFLHMFVMELRVPHQMTLSKSNKRGVIFGFSQAIQFFSWGTCIYVGAYLIERDEIVYKDIFTVASAIIWGAAMIGYSFSFTSDLNKALVAASRMMQLFQRIPKIDSNKETGSKLNEPIGNISMQEGEFSYPTRKNAKVLSRLRLSVRNGEKVALVGQSGCGKSTVIKLIQRLYDLDAGDLNIENSNIQSLNLPWTRSKMGIVSQDPVLFDRTIAENIMYGDNTRNIGMEEVMDAARRANVHNFIVSLPLGYETLIGERGTQLSGGQRQRVAIARALIRNPNILLLDEATSALDIESEKIVQEALDAAQVGRTSITIAHRLSTIQGVDMIYVIDMGQVVECGTHTELLEHRGIYHKLWNSN